MVTCIWYTLCSHKHTIKQEKTCGLCLSVHQFVSNFSPIHVWQRDIYNACSMFSIWSNNRTILHAWCTYCIFSISQLWVGLLSQDGTDSLQWCWTDQTIMTLTLWDSENPDELAQSCALARSSRNYQLNDAPCSYQRSYICEGKIRSLCSKSAQ